MCAKIRLLVLSACLMSAAASFTSNAGADEPGALAVEEVAAEVDVREQVPTAASLRPTPTPTDVERLLRHLAKLTPSDYNEQRQFIVQLKRRHSELNQELANSRHDLRNAEKRTIILKAMRLQAERDLQLSKQNLDEMTLKASAAELAKKQAARTLAESQAVQEQAKREQTEAHHAQEAAAKSAAAAAKLKAEAAAEEATARQRKRDWARKEAEAQLAKEKAAEAENQAAAERTSAARIEAAALAAKEEAIAKEAQAKLTEERGAQAEQEADAAEDDTAERKKFFEALIEQAAKCEKATSDQVAVAAKRADAAAKGKQQLIDSSRKLRDRQVEFAQQVGTLLIELGIEQPAREEQLVEFETPSAVEPPIEVVEPEDEVVRPTQPASGWNPNYSRRRLILFRGF